MKYWIKLYHEILDDPKMGRLSDRLFRRCIEMFLLAGKHDEDGSLPKLDEMAWMLRLGVEELRADVDALAEQGIITKDEDGYFVTHFAERQAAATGSERIRRYRERLHRGQYTSNVTVTSDVTKSVTNRCVEPELEEKRKEVDVDAAPEKIGDGDDDPPEPEPEAQEKPPPELDPDAIRKNLSAVYKAWEAARGGLINPLDVEQLADLAQEFSEDWCISAIHEANAGRNGKLISLNFVRAILERWGKEGYKAPRDAPSPDSKAAKATRKRDTAEWVRKQLRAEGIPAEKIEAAIRQEIGEGY
ncbi:MAG: hypothetical protein GXY76_17015 [Chloroflexi bacterium]|nr:hypothetical protein [Chloroflexota bacterium]